MSSESTSASAAGHFTAKMGKHDQQRTQLDGYLMTHANCSLPLARTTSVQDALMLWHWSEEFIARPPVEGVTRTRVSFAYGEMSIDKCAVNLRSTNVLNRRDTIHRILLPEDAESSSGLILPLVLVQRVGLPNNVADIAMADLDQADVTPISDETVYNPTLALSVLRAASLLCQFIRADLT